MMIHTWNTVIHGICNVTLIQGYS